MKPKSLKRKPPISIFCLKNSLTSFHPLCISLSFCLPFLPSEIIYVYSVPAPPSGTYLDFNNTWSLQDALVEHHISSEERAMQMKASALLCLIYPIACLHRTTASSWQTLAREVALWKCSPCEFWFSLPLSLSGTAWQSGVSLSLGGEWTWSFEEILQTWTQLYSTALQPTVSWCVRSMEDKYSGWYFTWIHAWKRMNDEAWMDFWGWSLGRILKGDRQTQIQLNAKVIAVKRALI